MILHFRPWPAGSPHAEDAATIAGLAGEASLVPGAAAHWSLERGGTVGGARAYQRRPRPRRVPPGDAGLRARRPNPPRAGAGRRAAPAAGRRTPPRYRHRGG